jgi:hypothetical protein
MRAGRWYPTSRRPRRGHRERPGRPRENRHQQGRRAVPAEPGHRRPRDARRGGPAPLPALPARLRGAGRERALPPGPGCSTRGRRHRDPRPPGRGRTRPTSSTPASSAQACCCPAGPSRAWSCSSAATTRTRVRSQSSTEVPDLDDVGAGWKAGLVYATERLVAGATAWRPADTQADERTYHSTGPAAARLHRPLRGRRPRHPPPGHRTGEVWAPRTCPPAPAPT